MNKSLHLVHAALELRQGKEYAEAATLLKQAIKLNQEYVPSYVYLGLIYQDLQKFSEAEDAFRSALRQEPENPEAIQCLGLLYLQQKRYSEAIANLAKHLQLEPANETTLDVLIPLLRSENRVQEAENLIKAAWENARDVRSAVRYVRFLISLENFEQASQFLKVALQRLVHPHLYVELALVLVVQENYSEAIDALNQAISLRPNYDRAYRGLAHCYTKIGQGEKAVEFAELALTITPRHYRNWQAKADALILLKRYEDAVQVTNTGIEIIKESSSSEREEARPVLNVLFSQRFHAQRLSGKIEEAITGMEEARAEFPSEGRFYTYPVLLFLQYERAKEAVECARTAMQTAPAEYIKNEILGILLQSGVEFYQAGNTLLAGDILKELPDLYPGIPQVHTAAAYVLTGDGDLEQAEAQINMALENADSNERGLCLCDLGYIDLLRGEYSKSEAAFREVLSCQEAEGYLRIAFLRQGRMVPDYKPHPTRSVSTHWAALANLAALSLYWQDLERAEQIAAQLSDHSENSCTSHMILGCVKFERGDQAAAQQAWETALQCADDPGEVGLLQNWLEDIAGSERQA